MVYLLFRFCLASKSKKGGENGKQFFRQLSEHIKNFKSFIQDKLSKKKKPNSSRVLFIINPWPLSNFTVLTVLYTTPTQYITATVQMEL